MKKEKILKLNKINYRITNLLGTNEVNVLEDVQSEFYKGQIAGIIGKSGAGKSCLLRIIAGLLEQTSGEVKFYGENEKEGDVKTSMVFQDFALFPWLNVRENVELGLRSVKLNEKDIYSRSMDMLDLVGLDGFANSYPKELSGGMKQRVGFARALVSEPDILLLDEPFSSLDILTAESLRSDFLELWQHSLLPIKAAIMVTHDISDLLAACDRVLFMEGKTGQFYNEIEISLPKPRQEDHPKYQKISKEIYDTVFHDLDQKVKGSKKDAEDLLYSISRVDISMLLGFMEMLTSKKYKGEAEIRELSDNLHIELDDITACVEFASMLDFVKYESGFIRATSFGKGFVENKNDNKQLIFASKLKKYIPIISELEKIYKKEKSKSKALNEVEEKIAHKIGKDKAVKIISAISRWVKYAEIM